MLRLKIIIAGIIIALWSFNITSLTMVGIATTAGVTTGHTIIIAGIGGTTASRISRTTDDKQLTCINGAGRRRFLLRLPMSDLGRFQSVTGAGQCFCPLS